MITEYRRIKQAELDRMIKEAIKNRNRKGLDSNIPERYKGYTFNDLLEYKYNQDITQITINKFDEIEKNPYGLFYYGKAGNGKTTQLSVMAQELQNKKNYKVYYTTEKRLLSEYQKTFNMKGKSVYDVIDNIIKNHDVICVDEWGQDTSNWAKDWIKSLLDEIYNNRKILFCTSNYSMKDLLVRYNENGKGSVDVTSQQIIDRLGELTKSVFLSGDSLRKKL